MGRALAKPITQPRRKDGFRSAVPIPTRVLPLCTIAEEGRSSPYKWELIRCLPNITKSRSAISYILKNDVDADRVSNVFSELFVDVKKKWPKM